MGRITLSLQQKIGLLFLLLSLPTWAADFEGVKLSDSMKCGDKMLPLQGRGIRTATFMKIKIYVLAYYAEAPVKKSEDAPLNQRPMCFEITYLKNFDNEDVDKAWDYQFKESSNYNYPALPEHVSEIKKFFGEIHGLRKQSFVLTADSTQVLENDILKGEIKGPEFQKNFLSLWFGTTPPTEDLQRELFKGVAP